MLASLAASGRQWLTLSNDERFIFVASTASSGYIYEVDRKAGGIVWKQTLGMPSGAPAQGPNGGLLVPLQNGLVALDFTKSGGLVTRYTAAGFVEGVAVDMTTGAVYITTGSGDVQNLYMAGSAFAKYWDQNPTTAAAYAPLLAPAPAGLYLYVTTVNGNAAAFAPSSGGVLWSSTNDTDLATAPGYGSIDNQNTLAIITISSSGNVSALDAGSGKIIWRQSNVVSGKVDAAAIAYPH